MFVLLAEVSSTLVGITFSPERVHLHENAVQNVNFSLNLKSSPDDKDGLAGTYRFVGSDPQVAEILQYEFRIRDKIISDNGTVYYGSFEVRGKFLGYSDFHLEKHHREGYQKATLEGENLKVSVVRDKQFIQTIFIISVATVVSISYINMGCALDMDEVISCLRRPVGPAIGLFSQYVCMPLVSRNFNPFILDPLIFYLKFAYFFSFSLIRSHSPLLNCCSIKHI